MSGPPSMSAMLEAMQPLSRKPMSEQVALKLLDLIRTGNLKAGDKLPTESELGAALQVSRPVVREALRGLSILGVVESRQGGRCYITDLSPARLLAPLQMLIGSDENNVEALYEARSAVEGELLRLGVGRVTDARIAHLRHLVQVGHELTHDAVSFRVLDLEFHQTLMALAGSPMLERIARSLYDLGIEYRRVASESPGVLQRSAKEHAAIVDAVAARDAERAAEAMRAHLRGIAVTSYDAMAKLQGARDGKS